MGAARRRRLLPAHKLILAYDLAVAFHPAVAGGAGAGSDATIGANSRRGILHTAVQREDGSWVWRYARFRATDAGPSDGGNVIEQAGALIGQVALRAFRGNRSACRRQRLAQHLIRVAPFVVVPAHDLEQVPADDPGQLEIDNGRTRIANDVR